MSIDLKNKYIVVTGGAGFLGSVICRKLQESGCNHVFVPRSVDYDLTDELGVIRMYNDFDPDVVLHLAADVGGIGANMEHPGRFFYNNLAMGLHLIEHARQRCIDKFVQVGTVCAYPKLTNVPFKEDDLWNGYPEETNAPYGVAKKALFVMLDAYKREYNLNSSVVVPVNLYGPGDNFDTHSSHVIPALIHKIHSAIRNKDKTITCWGTGRASREFLYVEDAADGVIAATESMDDPTPINLGTGNEITIYDLVSLIAKLMNFRGEIEWDSSKPDGQPRRCLDTSRAQELLQWTSKIDLEKGLISTIDWFIAKNES